MKHPDLCRHPCEAPSDPCQISLTFVYYPLTLLKHSIPCIQSAKGIQLVSLVKRTKSERISKLNVDSPKRRHSASIDVEYQIPPDAEEGYVEENRQKASIPLKFSNSITFSTPGKEIVRFLPWQTGAHVHTCEHILHTHVHTYCTHMYTHVNTYCTHMCTHTVHTCTHMYTHVHTHASTHMYKHVRSCTLTCTHTHTHTHTCTNMYVLVHSHVHIHVHAHVHTHTHMHVLVHSHVHIHVHAHVHTHTHITLIYARSYARMYACTHKICLTHMHAQHVHMITHSQHTKHTSLTLCAYVYLHMDSTASGYIIVV